MSHLLGTFRRPLLVIALAAVMLAGLVPLLAGTDATSAAAAPSSAPAAALSSTERAARAERRGPATLFGASVPTDSVDWRTGVHRADDRYGHMDTVRVYEPFVRDTFNRLLDGFGRPVVVSFRELPQRVLSGALDHELRTFFRHAPKHRPTYWSYLHEPEDDAARGLFSARQYRAAWHHINAIARGVGNPRLKPTLILMCWTARPASGRSVRAYYPGRFIDVMAWDCYSPKGAARYMAPRKLMGPAYRVTRRLGNRFGVGELASRLLPWDDGSGRARWLRNVGRYTDRRDAAFVTYWDSQSPGIDFRLTDAPSRRAWRDVIDR